jgi:hypothetical protein
MGAVKPVYHPGNTIVSLARLVGGLCLRVRAGTLCASKNGPSTGFR